MGGGVGGVGGVCGVGGLEGRNMTSVLLSQVWSGAEPVHIQAES